MKPRILFLRAILSRNKASSRLWTKFIECFFQLFRSSLNFRKVKRSFSALDLKKKRISVSHRWKMFSRRNDRKMTCVTFYYFFLIETKVDVEQIFFLRSFFYFSRREKLSEFCFKSHRQNFIFHREVQFDRAFSSIRSFDFTRLVLRSNQRAKRIIFFERTTFSLGRFTDPFSTRLRICISFFVTKKRKRTVKFVFKSQMLMGNLIHIDFRIQEKVCWENRVETTKICLLADRVSFLWLVCIFKWSLYSTRKKRYN